MLELSSDAFLADPLIINVDAARLSVADKSPAVNALAESI